MTTEERIRALIEQQRALSQNIEKLMTEQREYSERIRALLNISETRWRQLGKSGNL